MRGRAVYRVLMPSSLSCRLAAFDNRDQAVRDMVGFLEDECASGAVRAFIGGLSAEAGVPEEHLMDALHRMYAQQNQAGTRE